ncbi:MAG: 2-oxo acid dehydrogenase subunit E2 [Gorillibacterium sp.]|nr:2-oxo acid dehydrogenase subunit E2 [Gorillibacterium sp.]
MMESGNRGTAVPVPHLAESLVAATVGKWLKQPGDFVTQYEVICELITEKVNVEMPSPFEGTITAIVVAEGMTAGVGEALCYIQEQSSASPQSAAEQQVRAPRGPEPALGADSGAAAQHSPLPPSAAAGLAASGGEMHGRYSPAVLKVAAERGVALAAVPGTGMGGRVTRKDVLVYAEQAARTGASSAAAAWSAGVTPVLQAQRLAAPLAAPAYATAPLAQQAPAGPARTSGLHLTDELATPLTDVGGGSGGRGESFIDVTPIRATIASRMRQSVSEIPHAWTMVEVDVTNLVQLRTKLKDDFMRKEGVNLTYLAFLLKAVVNAIKDYPIINSVWAVDKIIVKRDINISLAVGTDEMVITPVIKKADQKNIAGLAQEIDALTKKARSGKLTLDDLQGGTFTVNNTGSFGSLLSYPIINYPQAAILTFESIVKKPVVINDMIAVRSMVNMCLSLDHRILDGVICGRFLQRIKENMESYGMQTSVY